MLDEMYSQYETILNERLDNIDGLLKEMIDYSNTNSEIVNSTINTATDKVGYTVTDGLKSVWSSTDSGVNKVVSEFNGNFTTTMTTTNNLIKSIYDLINKNVKNADKDIDKNTKPETNISNDVTGKTPSGSNVGNNLGENSGSGNSNDSNNDSSGGSSKGNFFVYKKNTYPKSKLNINSSIIDRVKYNDFDPSWSNMAMYYEKMGFGSRSSYKGTASQNTKMLNWMKQNGFKRSGQLQSMVKVSQEDGLFLGRKDDYILARDDWEIAHDMTTRLIELAKTGVSPTSKSIGDIIMNISLPNVQNGEDFVNFLKSKKAQNIIQSYTTDLAVGKNSLSKYKYK